MSRPLSRSLLISALVVAGISAPPPAAFAAAAVQTDPAACRQSPARQTRRSILGGIGGAVAGNILGSNSVTRTITSVLPAQTMLTEALMNLLDTCEQQKAAQATETVTQQAETQGVGTRAAWRSDTRPGVSGSSTVTAATQTADGSNCMTVTDVVIVNGEETTVGKKMCRRPGASGYVLAA